MNIIVIFGVVATAIAAYYTYRQAKLAEKPSGTKEQQALETAPAGVPSPMSTPTPSAVLLMSPSPAPSASPVSTSVPTPIPSPRARLKPEPDEKSSLTPPSLEPRQEPSAKSTPTKSFVWGVPQSPCAKANYSDDLSLGEPYSDTDVGFYVEYISISGMTGVNIRMNSMAALKMPGEEKVRNVDIYAGFKQSARTSGCLYTFKVKEVTKTALKFSFNGSR
jgi:hypothetical protein